MAKAADACPRRPSRTSPDVRPGTLGHFGGAGQHAYEAVTALYYDSADQALTHFPAYERSLRKPSADGGRFHDPSRSFALYCRGVTIFEQP